MKRKSIFVTFLLVLALLAIAFPATANNPKTVGEQINLFYGPNEFPAGEPFYIKHGWSITPSYNPPTPVGIHGFELELDGIYQKADYLLNIYSLEYEQISRHWVCNFPDGMTGKHTFTGHWILPCQDAVESGIIPGPCPTPSEKIIVATRELTVTFVP
jgi:hypothetical protein